MVHDLRFGPDNDTVADARGEWFIAVALEEGENSLRFRVGDDDAAALNWLITFDPLMGAAPTEPTATVTPTVAPQPTPTPTPTQAPAPTVAATPTESPTVEPTEEFDEFFDGTHEVGVDIPPGTYRTEFAASGCYWARLSGFSGTVDDIIANNFGSGYQVVSIGRRDVAFESNGCDFWTSDLSAVTESDTEFGEGTFIVGTDVRPGTYQSSEGDGCYWARLSGFSGRIQDVIANDFRSSGRAIVQIRARDAGFTSSGCGVWTTR